MVGAKGVLAALALSPAFVSAGALAQNGSDLTFTAVRAGLALTEAKLDAFCFHLIEQEV